MSINTLHKGDDDGDDNDDDDDDNNNNKKKRIYSKQVRYNLKQKEKTCTLIDVAIPADRNVVQKEAENKLKHKRDKSNVEPEMYDYTSNNWSHWNSNVRLKEKFGSCTRETFDRFTTKDSYTWNITHNTESTAV